MQPSPPSPYYRVAAKALIFDADEKLLVLRNHNGEWELPGGGWEHEEDYRTCLERELQEELGIGLSSISDIQFIYRGYNSRRNFMAMRITVRAEVDSLDLTLGEDIQDYDFVDKERFSQMDFTPAEGNITDYVDRIWPDKLK